MIQLPEQDPCEICEGIAGRDEKCALIAETEVTVTLLNPYQFEVGQCCVVTRRHVATLLDLSDAEGAAIIEAAQRVARALIDTYQPLGILTFQNNGVYSGQEVPHYHYHVVPRQPGSDWGIGPPQLQKFPSAGRQAGTPHDPSGDAARRERVRLDAATYGRPHSFESPRLAFAATLAVACQLPIASPDSPGATSGNSINGLSHGIPHGHGFSRLRAG